MKHMLSILLLMIVFNSYGADFSIDTLKIESGILAENRTILVFGPVDLIASDSVTIIYMLDGEFSKYRFEKLCNEKHKQIIGVGIINTNRNRDLLPVKQAGRFLEFIENELVSFVESNYVVRKRILYGHSFGGAFTIFSMISKPALFDQYIASSPTPIMNLIDSDLYRKLDNELETNIKFYLSYGSEDMKQVKKWANRMVNSLSNLKLDHVKWRSEIFDGENHNTSDKISIVNGLESN